MTTNDWLELLVKKFGDRVKLLTANHLHITTFDGTACHNVWITKHGGGRCQLVGAANATGLLHPDKLVELIEQDDQQREYDSLRDQVVKLRAELSAASTGLNVQYEKNREQKAELAQWHQRRQEWEKEREELIAASAASVIAATPVWQSDWGKLPTDRCFGWVEHEGKIKPTLFNGMPGIAWPHYVCHEYGSVTNLSRGDLKGCKFALVTQTAPGATEPPKDRTSQPAESSPEASLKQLSPQAQFNHDHNLARALHRVARAMHDGECPQCHSIHDSREMQDGGDRGGWSCPACGFHITREEGKAIFAEFAPFMEQNLKVFLEWREKRSIEVEKASENPVIATPHSLVTQHFELTDEQANWLDRRGVLPEIPTETHPTPTSLKPAWHERHTKLKT